MFSVDIFAIGILKISIQTEISVFLGKLSKRLRSVFHLLLLSYTKGRFFRSVSFWSHVTPCFYCQSMITKS